MSTLEYSMMYQPATVVLAASGAPHAFPNIKNYFIYQQNLFGLLSHWYLLNIIKLKVILLDRIKVCNTYPTKQIIINNSNYSTIIYYKHDYHWRPRGFDLLKNSFSMFLLRSNDRHDKEKQLK